MEERTDEQLVTESRGGDLHAFNALALRWEPDIFRFLRRMTGDRDEAADLCQETMVRAYLNLAKLRNEGSFRPWLYQIALNLTRSRLRRRRTGHEPFEEDAPVAMRLAAERPRFEAPDRRSARLRVGEEVRSALDALPAPQREAILMREYHGLTTEEIAAVTGVAVGTVRTRIFYGLKEVRRTLEKRGWHGDEVQV